jgi:hypothetical protein
VFWPAQRSKVDSDLYWVLIVTSAMHQRLVKAHRDLVADRESLVANVAKLARNSLPLSFFAARDPGDGRGSYRWPPRPVPAAYGRVFRQPDHIVQPTAAVLPYRKEPGEIFSIFFRPSGSGAGVVGGSGGRVYRARVARNRAAARGGHRGGGSTWPRQPSHPADPSTRTLAARTCGSALR